MASSREVLLERIRRRLGERRIVWLGIRGTDAAPLLQFDTFDACLSLIAPLGPRQAFREVCLERLTSRRVDLDAYFLGDDFSAEAAAYRKAVWDALEEPCVVVPYRATTLVTVANMNQPETITLLGMNAELQAPFEEKAWVERGLAQSDVQVLPWTYYRADQFPRLSARLDEGPLVVRRERSSGGAGLSLVTSSEGLEAWKPATPDGYVAAAPYVEGALPLNIGACVAADGTVNVHAPSVQLIGVPGLTTRPFGYCGNDFARAARLGEATLGDLEAIAVQVGQWLGTRGWRGAFGLDLLCTSRGLFVTEVNPRFQGSTAASCELERAVSLPDIVLDHMAAFLGVTPDPRAPLTEWVPRAPPLAQVYLHNVRNSPAVAAGPLSSSEGLSWSFCPEQGVAVDPGAILIRAVTQQEVTNDGRRLYGPVARRLQRTASTEFEEGGKIGVANRIRS